MKTFSFPLSLALFGLSFAIQACNESEEPAKKPVQDSASRKLSAPSYELPPLSIKFKNKVGIPQMENEFEVMGGKPPYSTFVFGKEIDYTPGQLKFKAAVEGWIAVMVTDSEGRSSSASYQILHSVQAKWNGPVKSSTDWIEPAEKSNLVKKCDLSKNDEGEFDVSGGLPPYKAEIHGANSKSFVRILGDKGSLDSGESDETLEVVIRDSLGSETRLLNSKGQDLSICETVGERDLGFGEKGLERIDWKQMGDLTPEWFRIDKEQRMLLLFRKASSRLSEGDEIKIVRLDAHGKIDQSFGENGYFRRELPTPEDRALNPQIWNLGDDHFELSYITMDNQIHFLAIDEFGKLTSEKSAGLPGIRTDPFLSSHSPALFALQGRFVSIPIHKNLSGSSDHLWISSNPSGPDFNPGFQLTMVKNSDEKSSGIQMIPLSPITLDSHVSSFSPVVIDNEATGGENRILIMGRYFSPEPPNSHKEYLFAVGLNSEGSLNKSFGDNGLLTAEVRTIPNGAPGTQLSDPVPFKSIISGVGRSNDLLLLSSIVQNSTNSEDILPAMELTGGAHSNPLFQTLENFKMRRVSDGELLPWTRFLQRKQHFRVIGKYIYVLTDLGILKFYLGDLSDFGMKK